MKYRLNENGLEWWNEEKHKWETVTCQNSISAGDSCYRGCSAFEETIEYVDGQLTINDDGTVSEGDSFPIVRLTCGCGRTIKLEDA